MARNYKIQAIWALLRDLLIPTRHGQGEEEVVLLWREECIEKLPRPEANLTFTGLFS